MQVYEAVKDVKGIVRAMEPPSVQNGVYIVDLTPLAYHQQPKNEVELRAAVKVVLEALGMLHARGFVHRDIRWQNILYTGQVSCGSGSKRQGLDGSRVQVRGCPAG